MVLGIVVTKVRAGKGIIRMQFGKEFKKTNVQWHHVRHR
jgi:hypothetical protein